MSGGATRARKYQNFLLFLQIMSNYCLFKGATYGWVGGGGESNGVCKIGKNEK
jgi:hypothetical protein